jgi:hypothetical protein
LDVLGSLIAGSIIAFVAGCAPTGTSLSLAATGLGPCTKQWYMSCNYGIRIEGPGGYDHRGNFAWDQGVPSVGPEPAHGPNGPVKSTGTWGDVPATLGRGEWTISFRLWYGSDAIQLVPVAGGTPRMREEDPFTEACSTQVDTTGLEKVTIRVAFDGNACTVETQLAAGSGASGGTPT